MNRPIRALRYLASLALLAMLLLSSAGAMAQDPADATPASSDPPTTESASLCPEEADPSVCGDEAPPPPPPADDGGGSEPAPDTGPPPAPEPEVTDPPADDTDVPTDPTGEPTEDPTSEPTEEPTDTPSTDDEDPSGTPESTEEADTPTAEPTEDDAVQAAALEEPADLVSVSIQVYNCETDPGGGIDDCAAGAGLQVNISINGVPGTALTTDGSGLATAEVEEDALVVFSVVPPDGYVPQGNGLAQLTAADGASVIHLNVAEPEMGRLQISSGQCPTTGEARTEFIVAGPLVRAASVGCEAHGGSAFTLSGGNLGAPMSIVTDENGDWMGFVADGSYTLANSLGSASVTIDEGRITLVIVVDFVPGPTGTLVIQRWHCTTGGVDSTVITVTGDGSGGPPHESCTASNRTVSISPVNGGADPIIIELGADGASSLQLAEGSYIITDLATNQSETLEVSAAGTTMAVVTDTVVTGSLAGVVYWCADGASSQQDPTSAGYWQTNCTGPAAGAGVTLLNASGSTVGSTTTGGDGSFGFAALEPGAYSLVIANGCAQFAGGADARGGVAVSAGNTTSVAGYSCAPPSQPGPQDPPVNGGGGANPPTNGGQQPGGANNSGGGSSSGGHTARHGVDGVSSTVPSGSELYVTALPSTGTGATATPIPITVWLAMGLTALTLAGFALSLLRREKVPARTRS